MDLRETIKKVLREELYSPAGDKYKPGRYVYHISNPYWRESILNEGLKVIAGDCYTMYVGEDVECQPAIFATDSDNPKEFFYSTYDDDIWKIDTKCAKVKWFEDKHYHKLRTKHIVTFENIPLNCIELIHEGTGKDLTI